MPNCSGKGMSCGDAITRTHRPNGPFIVRHATSVFQIAEEAACGLVTSDCKSTALRLHTSTVFRTRRPARATTVSSPNEAHWRQKQTQSYATRRCTWPDFRPIDAASSAKRNIMAEFQGDRISELKDLGCCPL